MVRPKVSNHRKTRYIAWAIPNIDPEGNCFFQRIHSVGIPPKFGSEYPLVYGIYKLCPCPLYYLCLPTCHNRRRMSLADSGNLVALKIDSRLCTIRQSH